MDTELTLPVSGKGGFAPLHNPPRDRGLRSAPLLLEPDSQARPGLEPSAFAVYLGPALVIGEAADNRVQVALERDPGPEAEREVEARFAFALPYLPALGDLLLVMGSPGGEYYATGVLSGQGQTSLALSGDVELRAVGGTLKLGADRGLKLDAPETTITTGKLRTFARSLNEKVDEAFRWVKNKLHTRAGEQREVVDGDHSTTARRSTTLAEEVVKIDGQSVQLGH